MALPVRDMSPEDNMVLFNFKLKALQPPREPVRLMGVDDSVRVQVQEVKGSLADAHRKMNEHTGSLNAHRSLPKEQTEQLVQDRGDQLEI